MRRKRSDARDQPHDSSGPTSHRLGTRITDCRFHPHTLSGPTTRIFGTNHTGVSPRKSAQDWLYEAKCRVGLASNPLFFHLPLRFIKGFEDVVRTHVSAAERQA